MPETHAIIEAVPFSRADDKPKSRGLGLKPIPILVALLFIVLAIAATFMFTARAVKISFEPSAEQFSFENGFQYQLAERYLMLSGDYSFKAETTGYIPFEGKISVDDSADQDFLFELTKLPGRLKISTLPNIKARVYVDQQLAGITPLELDEISADRHDISIRSDRFLDYDTEIEIEGLRKLQQLEPVLIPAWAMVEVRSNPRAADIYVNGELLAKTPAAVEILRGESTLEIRKSGFKSWQLSIEVDAGINQSLATIVLEKSDGKIAINSTPIGALININGEFRGQTPLKLTLAPGKNYNIQLTKAGFQAINRQIKLNPEQDISLNNRLKPILGMLKIQIEPEGAELYIDEKLITNPSQQLSLTAKPHRIRISKTGFADYATTITPQPDAAQQLLVRLLTESEAKTAAIPTRITAASGQTLLLILPGELTMGAGRREPGRRSNEVSKQVNLRRSFYLSETEVTNLEYKRYRPGHTPGILERVKLDGDDRPVVNISWQEAAAYCNWLSAQAGLPAAYEQRGGRWLSIVPMNTGYRLPTEAEWAWSARYAKGPKPSRFPWGDNMPPIAVTANYADESAINMVPYHIIGYNDSFRGPSPVKQFPANELGIYGLAGNAAEWVNDYYSVEIPKQTLEDPIGPENGDYYVIRGSSYQHGRFSALRWTYRDYGDAIRPDVGFRVARYLE